MSIRVTDRCDTDTLAGEIAEGLEQLGVVGAQVNVEVVEGLSRPSSGKLVRFVPLR